MARDAEDVIEDWLEPKERREMLTALSVEAGVVFIRRKYLFIIASMGAALAMMFGFCFGVISH